MAEATNNAAVANNDEQTPIIFLDDIHVVFKTRTGSLLHPNKVHAVNGLSLKLMPGQTIGIVGESGCGKSTTANVMCGLQAPTSGHVYFKGTDVTKRSAAQRKIIGREFIRSFEAAQKQVIEEVGAAGGEVKFLVQGTLYPDVVESGGGEGAANINSHHNVGGLPEDMTFELVEPLRTLFKDEVRAVGRELGLPDYLVNRQPFPGPGLGIRIIGEVTRERLDILRAADLIAREELTAAGLDQEIWQCPVVLLADVRSVGVQGDGRTYGHPIVLRPVSSEDAMTADWTRLPYDVLARISTRITNSVPEVNRVVLDVTSKPPATIEWE